MRAGWVTVWLLASCGEAAKEPAPRLPPVIPPAIDAAPPADAPVVVDAAPAALPDPVAPSLPQLALRCTASADRPRLATKAPALDPAKFPLLRFAPPTTQAPRVVRGPDAPASYSDFTSTIAIAGDTVAFTEHRSIRLFVRDQPAREVKIKLLASHVAVSPDGRTVAATLHPASNEPFPKNGIAIIDVATGEVTRHVGPGVALDLGFTSDDKLLARTHDPERWDDTYDLELHDLAKGTKRSLRLTPPQNSSAPREQKVQLDDRNVTVRYTGQDLYIRATSVLADRGIALATTQAAYKRGQTGSFAYHPYLALARLDDKGLVRGAGLPVGGKVALVGDCAFVATETESGEHSAWVFHLVSGELARVALPPAKVRSISGAGDWLAIGYEDGAVSVVSAADWTQHAYWRAGRSDVRAIAIDAAGNVVTESAGELVRWSLSR